MQSQLESTWAHLRLQCLAWDHKYAELCTSEVAKPGLLLLEWRSERQNGVEENIFLYMIVLFTAWVFNTPNYFTIPDTLDTLHVVKG